MCMKSLCKETLGIYNCKLQSFPRYCLFFLEKVGRLENIFSFLCRMEICGVHLSKTNSYLRKQSLIHFSFLCLGQFCIVAVVDYFCLHHLYHSFRFPSPLLSCSYCSNNCDNVRHHKLYRQMREVQSAKVDLPKQLEIVAKLCCPHPSFEMLSRQASSAPLIQSLLANMHPQLLDSYSAAWPAPFP